MSREPYSAYKPSGIPWLGDVPDHWETRRLKESAMIIAGQSPPSEIVSENLDGFPFLQGNAEFGRMHPNPRLACETPPKSARAGDILLSVRAPVGALNVADRACGIGRGLCAVRPRSGLDGLFTYYALGIANQELLRLSTGSTYDAVTIGIVGGLGFPIPPLPEQAAIVRYLDHVDRRIRRYVSAKRKLIALLEEEKQAIINRAVTRGLDPNVRLKPSGVEWLGDVPAHWAIPRLRNLGDALIGLTYDPQNVVDGEAGMPVLRASNISNGQLVYGDNVFVGSAVPDKLVTREGDILICSRSGSRALIGKNARINAESAGTTFGAFMTVFRGANNDYLHQVFNSKFFEYRSAAFFTSTINQLTLGILYDMKVPFPPLEERQSILRYVEGTTAPINRAITRARRQIELLQEYRTRLIADVVTGKLDVREAAALLPDDPEDEDPIDEGSPLAEDAYGHSHGPDLSTEELTMESEVTV